MTVVKYLRNASRFDGTTMIRVKNINGNFVDVAIGGIVDLDEATLSRLAAYFIFVDPDSNDPPPDPGTGGGGGGGATAWKSPVATKAALNAVTDRAPGDVRAVIADESNGGRLSVYGYTGSGWQIASGSGGGGGSGAIVTETDDPPPDPAQYADGSIWIERV